MAAEDAEPAGIAGVAPDPARRWAEVERGAAAEVRDRLPGLFAAEAPAEQLVEAASRLREQVAAPVRPYDWFVGACGWQVGEVPGDDAALWTAAAASVLAPDGDPGWSATEQSAIFAICHRDWVTAVSGVAGAGVGTDSSAAALLAHAAADGVSAAGAGFALVVTLWRALGAIDDDGKLTALGWWGLPRALVAAWEQEIRDPSPASSTPAAPVTIPRTIFSQAVVEAYRRWYDDPREVLPADEATDVAEKLAHARTAEAVARNFADPAERGSWERFLTAVHQGAERSAPVAVLLARAAEWRADADAETSWLDRALASDDTHTGALLRAAEIAADAGDMPRAVDLLRRAGERRDDPRMAMYRQFASPPTTDTPRNAPCPCGSGRKHKACCLHRVRHPLPARASLLVFKVLTFLHRPPQMPELRRWAARAAGVADPDSPAAVLGLRGSATFDVALWEGGLFDKFAAVRGPSLPADERELARSWQPTARQLYEITAVRVGFAATLRSVADGTDHDVRDRAVDSGFGRGDHVIARLLPVAGEHRLGMVLRVPPAEHERVTGDPALLTDPDALLTWVREAGTRGGDRGGAIVAG